MNSILGHAGLLLSSSAYQNAVILATPLMYWPLNEISGSTAVDIVSGVNATYPSGVLNNQTPLFPALGRCYSLPGTSPNYLTFTSPAINTSISCECWIKLNSTSTGNIISFNDNNGLRIQISTIISVIYSSAAILSTSAGSITSGTTYHIVITISSTTTSIYINGSLITSTAHSWPGFSSVVSYIGATPAYSERVNGFMSNVAVYNRALTSTEVLSHYNIGIS